MSDLHALDEHWDAIVIGGGPAGSTTALGLARLGWRTLLIDKGSRGRRKCCGHCLNPRVGPLLDRLGLAPIIESVSIGRTRGVRIHFDDDRPIETPFGDGALGWITPRDRLDAALLDAAERADAVVIHNATTALEPSTPDEAPGLVHVSGAEESRTLSAGLVVGADGLNSSVARAAGLAGAMRNGRKYGFASTVSLTAQRNNPAREEESSVRSEGWVEMFVTRQGYLGVVDASPQELHIAALVATGVGRRPIAPAAFVSMMSRRFPALRNNEVFSEERIHGFDGAGPMPSRPRRIARAGVALVGDAAGYTEPFTGEGIACAIQSAAMLTDALGQCDPGRFSASCAARHQRRWRQVIRASHRRCAGIAWALGRPTLLGMTRAAAALGIRLDRHLAGAITRAEAAV